MSAAFYVSYVLLWALVVFQTLLNIGLVRAASAQGVVQGGGNDSLQGEPVPVFSAQDLRGATVTSRSFLGKQTALLFVSPDCSSCVVTLNELGSLKSKVDGNVVIFCLSDEDRCSKMVEHYSLDVPVVCDADRRIATLLKATIPPTAVLVDESGVVTLHGFPVSGDELEELQRANGKHRQEPAVEAVVET